MRKIVSFNHIIELNQLLQSENMNYKIHLRDSCCGQTMRIESLDSDHALPENKELHEKIINYFESQGIQLAFNDDGTSFWVVN